MPSDTDLDVDGVDIGLDEILDAAGLRDAAPPVRAADQSASSAERGSGAPWSRWDELTGDEFTLDTQPTASAASGLQDFASFFDDAPDDSTWDVPAPRQGVRAPIERGRGAVSAVQPDDSASLVSGVSRLPQFDVSLPEGDDDPAHDETIAGFGRVRTDAARRPREVVDAGGSRRPVLLRPPSRAGTDVADGEEGAVLGRARVVMRVVRRDAAGDADVDTDAFDRSPRSEVFVTETAEPGEDAARAPTPGTGAALLAALVPRAR